VERLPRVLRHPQGPLREEIRPDDASGSPHLGGLQPCGQDEEGRDQPLPSIFLEGPYGAADPALRVDTSGGQGSP
jgi:hypothetical protein